VEVELKAMLKTRKFRAPDMVGRKPVRFLLQESTGFSILRIRKADNLRFAPRRADKHSDCSPGGISERKRWTLGRSDTAESETRNAQFQTQKADSFRFAHRLHKNYCIESVSWGYVRSSEFTEIRNKYG